MIYAHSRGKRKNQDERKNIHVRNKVYSICVNIYTAKIKKKQKKKLIKQKIIVFRWNRNIRIYCLHH